MIYKSEVFDVNFELLNDENYFHFVNIEEIHAPLKDLIDQMISEICYGNPNRDIKIVKKRLLRLLKDDPNHLMGAIAEFFAIIYLKSLGFKQEFLFTNLEENSAKKGFDGYYTMSGEDWIFESKSGDKNSKGGTHYEKIGVAYRGLKNTIAGKGKKKNNPWENALNHSNIVNNNTESNLKKKLTKLADNFELEIYDNIKNHNIIPASTIYLNDDWEKINKAELATLLKQYFYDKDFNKLNVLCINKKTINLFLDYLNL